MDFWLIPTSNVILNTVLRSLVLVAFLYFFQKTDLYVAYWWAIVHDIISLIVIYPYLY